MFFLASYVLFIFLGLYFIALLKRTNIEFLINKTKDVWFFLFFANNGALLMSLFSLTILVDRFGISIILLFNCNLFCWHFDIYMQNERSEMC